MHSTTNPYDSPPASPQFTHQAPHHSLPTPTSSPTSSTSSSSTTIPSADNYALHQTHPQGQIKLIGAGPGDPDLLTMAAYKAISGWADIVLADKLVSKEILDLVTCPLFIANKDKGCQASGQQELFDRATRALQEGKKVVRLKQGDPFIFGRGGEEYLFFRKLGYKATIVPGLSSSIAGPLLAQIPLTHRGIASQFLVCTGTGSQDSIPDTPTFVPHRTTVFLMAMHRLESLVKDLEGAGYPLDLPVAVVERASAKDQRCVRATVGTVVQVIKEAGYRPPGILIAGWACDALVEDPLQLQDLEASLPTRVAI